MLDQALTFLVSELNAYLLARTSSDFGAARLGRLVDDSGKWAINEDHIGVAVINVEEERVMRDQLPSLTSVAGKLKVAPPEIKLNLHVLFAAYFQQYEVALRYLSHTITYFQANPIFSPDRQPALDARFGKLVVELQSLTYEQLNQIWTFIGAKQLPAAVYKVRLVALQDESYVIAAPVIEATSRLGRS